MDHHSKKTCVSIENGCINKVSVIMYTWWQKDVEIIIKQLLGASIGGGIICFYGGIDENDKTKAQSKIIIILSVCSHIINITYYWRPF